MESSQPLCIIGDTRWQQLQCDRTLELRVVGAIDLTHTAAANPRHDAIAAGDAPGQLERRTIDDGGGWRLELAPRTADLSRIVKRATLEGSGATVSQMTLEEENGDSTVLRFSDVDLNVHYDAASRARTFRLP